MVSCIIVSNTVTKILPRNAYGRGRTEATWHGWNSCQRRALVHLRNSQDHEHHNGKLVQKTWQNVVNRAVRMLALGPFGSHFFLARALFLIENHFEASARNLIILPSRSGHI
ncbi:hypothetical protein KIN20_015312 [Parelaphostrongylus tenuis]|uniref:Uncharacterized protein n=1 Tax=Parelaphostrongylus tenuis TaxID=148309 RepID=A0AAD5N0H5_PARTN|nr:hypothetical protein KIN20_015312 [Parelaphostrongylus tenuis]